LKEVGELFDQYRLDETIGTIEKLFMSLSRDYIKFVRDRSGNEKVVSETIKEVYIGVLKMFSTICPFISEDLWQKMNQKEKSVHLCNWPKSNSKKINKNLEVEFETVMKVIESGLSVRDKEGIGLRWPLAKAEVSCKENLNKSLLDIIARQLNVKKVELKHGKGDLLVKLDLKMTPELEAEGFVREISRRVQAERKKRGLKKEDSIELEVFTKDIKSKIEKFKEMLMERTGAKSIRFTDDKSSGWVDIKIRGNEIRFNF